MGHAHYGLLVFDVEVLWSCKQVIFKSGKHLRKEKKTNSLLEIYAFNLFFQFSWQFKGHSNLSISKYGNKYINT